MIDVKDVKVGVKIVFPNFEKRPYTVKAFDGRYAICTKPFNIQKTVVYTIIDFKLKIRGANNLVFNSYDYKVQKDIDRCLKDIASGKIQISGRNRVSLDPLDYIKY